VTYRTKLLVTLPQRALVAGAWPTPLEDCGAQIDPALCGRLAKIDFLCFVAAGEGVEVNPLKLR
jgi:hypothetical protein